MTGETPEAMEESMTMEEAEGQSMAHLLEEQAEFHTKLEKREVVWVKVVQVSTDQVLVDIGEKNEAVIPLSEFPAGEAPTAGRRVPAILVKRGHGDRQPTTMSAAKARWKLGWELALKAFADKARVRGKVLSSVKGGFLVDGGVTAFLPSSLADLRPVRKPEALIGTGVRCVILELNQEKGQMVISRKAVLEEEAGKRKTKMLEELKPGMIRIGRVVKSSELGLVVDIGGLEGVVHTADVAWRDAEAAKAKVERGAKVRVRVLKIEAEDGKVSLGMKQLTAHPGDALRKKYAPKSVVKGEVKEILPEGVRVAINATDTAFCEVAELPVDGIEPKREKWDREKGPTLPPIWPKVGDKVSGIVLGIGGPNFEVAISIKRFEAIQDRKHVQRYLKGAPPLTLGQLFNLDE